MTVQIWWTALRAVAVLNIALWIISAGVLARQHVGFFSAVEHQRKRWMLWLASAYVAGCSFRSFLPRIDLERVCLVQSQLSSMVVGRSVATVAELCFIGQCALLLYHAGNETGSKFVKSVAILSLPLMAIAECASWYAILSKNYLGHVLENSIWTFFSILLVATFLVLWPQSDRPKRWFLAAMMAFAMSYIVFMTSVDVPMYWSRWNEELMAGTNYLSLSQGLIDASGACIVDFRGNTWRMEIPWMTLYFSVAVWVSISLSHVSGWNNEPSKWELATRIPSNGDAKEASLE